MTVASGMRSKAKETNPVFSLSRLDRAYRNGMANSGTTIAPIRRSVIQLYPFSFDSFDRSMSTFNLEARMIIESPTAASIAASAMVNNTRTCPVTMGGLRRRVEDKKFRLAAVQINSTGKSIGMGLPLGGRPQVPN